MTLREKNQRVQISLDISFELYETLNQLAHKINGDNAEVLLKAITLMEVAVEAKQRGKSLWIADENNNMESKIVGI
ncbi:MULTISPECIES: hypothetical protein [Nostocales]|uniref:DNA-binding protein n=3 Tax=Nostocales TaxID=1161 RepID=A0A0C1QXN9_9CYAN|nr:hypothetical protein [Tolypothrix bouteillei]KAF3886250.1 DNA-binding protein [Tolypothrix bouteillei VB521301]